jgi:hypothetical protein
MGILIGKKYHFLIEKKSQQLLKLLVFCLKKINTNYKSISSVLYNWHATFSVK